MNIENWLVVESVVLLFVGIYILRELTHKK